MIMIRGYNESIKRYKKKPVIIEALEYTEDNYELAIKFVGKENCIVKVYDALILIKKVLKLVLLSEPLRVI